MPRPRSEVACTVYRGGIAVIGGLRGFGFQSGKVGVFAPATGRWRRLPDLPIEVDHAAAASLGSQSFDPATGEWSMLQPLPEARSGTGLAPAGGLLVSVGGEDTEKTLDTVFGYDLGDRRGGSFRGCRLRGTG
jgi:hypothetical protein